MRRLLIVLAILAAIPAALLLFLFIEHELPLTLPSPAGPFAVGRVAGAWHDAARNRDLAVWIWYPSVAGSGRPADYMPPAWRRALAHEQGFVMRELLTRDPARVHAHALESTPVSPARPAYPVVLFRSGIGALATDYTTIAENLASRGYVVVGADTPGSTFVVVLPDGRVLRRTREGHPSEELPQAERERMAEQLIGVWTADNRFLADQLARLNASDARFAHRLDLDRLGAAGHSFGGAPAAQFCHDDRRCKAGIDIDGMLFGSVVRDGLRQPFLFLLSDHSREHDPAGQRVLANIAAMRRPVVTIAGAHHFSFSDQSLLKSALLFRLLRAIGVIGPLDSRRGLAIVNARIADFFDRQLR
jgi:predicted dienelactone hydrolase